MGRCVFGESRRGWIFEILIFCKESIVVFGRVLSFKYILYLIEFKWDYLFFFNVFCIR